MKSTISCLLFMLLLGDVIVGTAHNSENIPESIQSNQCLTNPCVMVTCPPDLTIDCIENFNPNAVNATAMSSCGMITAQWVTQPDQTGGPNCPQTTYVYTYKALDDQGNIGCCEQTVTIDNAAPVITVPPGFIVDCYDDCLVFEDDATVITSCGEVLEVTIYSPVINGILDCPGTTYTWIYRVEDQCEREATAERIFTNGDNDPPVIDAPDDTTCECFAGINAIPDNAAVSTACTLGAATEVNFIGSNGIMDCPGTTYVYEYKTTDDCGRMATDFQVYTIANGPPVFDNCPENCLTLDCDEDYEWLIQAWLSGVTAHSFCGLPLQVTNDYDPAGQGICFDDGTVTVNFYATDQCGRTSVCQGMILVLDTEAPQFGPLPAGQTVECDGTIEFEDVLATDNCTDVTLTYEDEMVADVCSGGAATRTWTATDECGNSAVVMQMITVLPDTEAPVFTFVPDDHSIDCNGTVLFGDAVAVDDCSNVELSFVDDLSGDVCTGGTATRTWTAEDDCGNTSVAVQTITILPDMEAPVFTFVPVDMTIDCGESVVFGDNASASDNCGNVTLSFVDGMAGDLCAGSTATRTWTAEDDCGNTAMASQTITILPDVEVPQFSFVPPDLTIDCYETVLFGDDAMAADDCGNVTLSFVDGMSGDVCSGGMATRTWTAEDDCGNTATASQTITILPDMENPEFTFVPSDLTINCGDPPVFGNASASDDCGNVTLSFVDGMSGDVCSGGTATRTWTAEDDCGNTVMASQTITILPDMENPEFSFVPADLTIDCDDPVVFGDPVASDDCGNISLSFLDNTTGSVCTGQIATRTWTAEDECGNTAMASQTVTVLPDMEAPVFTFVPSDLTIACDDPVVFGDDAIATDDCSSVTLGFTDNITGDLCSGQTAIRTWTATDDCGNTAFASQVITILPDTEAPEFDFIPSDLTVNCDDPVVFGQPSATDNCGNTNISFMDEMSGELCSGQTAIRTWTATDDCGNTASANQVITILPDTEAPQFSFVPPDLTIDCDDPVVFGSPVASDNCSNVNIFPSDDMTGDLCNGSTVTRTWTAIDDCGNVSSASQAITVLPDTDSPVFTFVPADLTIDCDDPVVFGDNALADDDCGNVSLTFVDLTVGDLCTGQTAMRTWTAEDDCGNTSMAVQTITILPDTDSPVFTFVPADLTIDCDDPVVFGDDALADDDCGNVSLTFVDLTVGDLCTGQTAMRTWTAEDDCGNTAVAVQTITILPDTDPPVFTFVPVDITIACDDPVVFGDNASAGDDCGSVSLTFVDLTVGDLCTGQTATRSWTAEDDCGNTSMAVQTITVLPDTESPVFTFVPADLTIDCDDPVAFGDDALADDDCGNVSLTFVDLTVGDLCTGQTATRSWTAEDDCGNTSMAVQTITILPDTDPPVFTFVPVDITIACDDPVVFGDNALAGDDCGNVSLTFVDLTVGDLCTGQTATRSWTAEDDCGNTSMAVQTITILPDTESPVFTFVPADLTIDCDDPVVFGDNALAGDDCGNVSLTFVDATVGTLCTGQTATRSWTAEDDCGNTSMAVQTITILPDTESPVFTFVPVDLTIDCDDPVVFGDNALADDDCGNVSLTFVDATVGTLCTGQTATRSWTAEDDCGNTSMAVQTITILPDTESPVFTFVPADLTIDCDEQIVFGDATAEDDCGTVTLTLGDQIVGDLCTGQTATRTWTAVDNCGNTSMAVQTITVLPDTDSPVFTFVPADVTIDCDDPVVFGDDALADDDCGNVNLTFVDLTVGDLCTGQTATRSWTAEDDCGNTSMAVQTITILPDTEAPVFTFVPADYSADCNDPVVFGDPAASDNCGNVMLTFEDETTGDFCLGGMATRTWTATDDCGNSSMATQTITFIPDEEDPVLNCPDTLILNIQSVGVCELIGVLVPNATDNCTLNPQISYAIDFGDDGSIDSMGVVVNPLLFITYPIGINTVTFTTEDDCGNTDTCTSVVIVNDLVPPGFFCNPVTVTLSVLDSMGNVTPGEFIFPPFFECCEDTLLFELPDGTFTDSLFFDCDDTQFVNGIDVKIRAFDCFGNSSACDTKVFVIPPAEDPDFCNSEPPPFAFVTGQLATEEGDFMDSVYVELNGGMYEETMTSEVGYYEFLNLPTSDDYSIQPYLDEEPLNGLSTMDIILINQHVLAVELLDSPYKMIAADVNRSGSITVLDALKIQQLILGSTPEFENNTSWRFVDANFLFPNSENPFANTFPEVCYITDLYAGVSHVDFVGIKTGDVNGTASVNFQNSDSEDRGEGELLFTTPEQQILKDETVSIPFRALDFQQILGFQFSLEFDRDILDFTGIRPGKLADMEENNFGYNFLEDGVLTASWHSTSPYSVVDGDVLFELEFKSKESAFLNNSVALTAFFTKAEAYREGESVLELSLRFTGAEALPGEPLEFQNRPNPFKDEAIISFHLNREIRGVFTLLDINRQVIMQKRGMFPEGYNEFVIRGKDLPAYGIYYYQFKTAKHNIWRKMVFIDDL